MAARCSTLSRLSFLLLVCLLLPVFAGCFGPDLQRRESLRAIARWEDRRLAPADSLRAMIGAGDAHVRLAAVRAAGLIGRDFIVPEVAAAVGDRSATVGRQACFSLGLLGSPAAVAALDSAAADPRPGIRLAALRGLAQTAGGTDILLAAADGADGAEAAAAWDALRNHASAADPATLVPAITAALARAEPDVQWRVLRCAELVPDSTLVPVIAPFARSSGIQVRVHAYRALARQPGPRALAAVLAGAADHDRFQGRDQARADIALCRALGATGPSATAAGAPDAAEAGELAGLLIRAAGAADPHVAETALQAMARSVGQVPLPPEAAAQESLLPVWRIRMARTARERLDSPHLGVRAAALTAWPALRGAGCAGELTARLRQEPAPFALAAGLRALGEVHPDPLPALAPWAEGRAPTGTGPGGAAPPVPALVQVAALEALAAAVADLPATTGGGMARTQATAAVTGILIRAAAADDYVVAATAAGLLAGFPRARAVAALATLWGTAAGEGRNEIRRAVLSALEGIFAAAGDSVVTATAALDSLRPAAAAVLRQGFDAPDMRIRREARQTALATGLLPADLVPSDASLLATLPAVTRDAAQPPVALPFAAGRVRVLTDRGSFVIALDGEIAPNTCAVFLDLIGRGFYDDLSFHRVVPDFVVQGGDPRGDGWGGPGYVIRSEWSAAPFTRGTVGIAHDGKDTGGSQFFVTLSEQPHLVGRYTVFGRVTEGMDVVDVLEVGDRFRIETVP